MRLASSNRHLPSIGWGVATFAFSLSVYSAVVVLTTPNLPPLASLQTALALNPHIMLGMPVGVGLQAYLMSYTRRIACPVRIGKTALGTGSGSALSALFSFFALTQVGCCTLWLFYLSLLPSLMGVGAAAFLIQYSAVLSNLSLIIVAIPIAILLGKIADKRRSP